MSRTNRIILSLAFVFLSACSIDVKSPGLNLDPKDIKIPEIKIPEGEFKLDFDSQLVTCSAVPVSSMVVSGQPVVVTVKAKGGVAPYEILGTALAFDSETVVSETFVNDTTASKISLGNVIVKDQVGLISQCNYYVTVLPAGSTPSNLACVLNASPANPAVDANVAFSAAATGGTAPYSFSQFAMGSGGTITTALSSSGASATAAGKYTSSGLKTASIQLQDSAGATVVCAKTVDVASLAAVNLLASPATAVHIGSNIQLTATPNGFSSTPTYSFTTTRAGVTITPSGATATVTSSVEQAPFDVVVTATNGSQTATATISLAFTPVTTLACSISHPAGILRVNENIKFDVTASNGNALLITDFTSHSDVTSVSQTDSSRTVKYSVPGVKWVFIKAKSKTTGALCQAGAWMGDMIEVSPASTGSTLSCTGYTSYNPSYENEWFWAWASISGGQGTKWVDTISIKKGTTSVSFGYDWIDAVTAQLVLAQDGTYTVKFNLKDSYGNTGSCTTTHVVNNWWY